MTYRILALDPEPFAPLFALSDAELEARGARRIVSDGAGVPCRVSFVDVPAGAEAILTNYGHHDVSTSPFQASGPVFVSQAPHAELAADVVPDQLARRLLSVRAYDAEGLMQTADVTEGASLDAMLKLFFADAGVAYVHIHYARQGCYAARALRA